MNNETNRENSAFERRFWDGLHQQPVQNSSPLTEGELNPLVEQQENSRVDDLEWDELDPLNSEEIDVSNQDSQRFTLGDMPLVRNRFEGLLKDRLKATIELNPPLFPWETEEHSSFEYPDVLLDEQVPVPNLWLAQRQQFKWSFPLPESVFAQLLTPCQTVLQSALREGAKLVRAVETLFPDQSQPLNELAGFVIRGSLRGPLDLTESQPCYETATPEQQMVLLLLAAQEILNTLTLNCRLNEPLVRQDWLTAFGQLTVEAEYVQSDYGTSLKILGQLPAGGRLQLLGNKTEAAAQRSDSGYLKLELIDPEPNRIYRLHVLLHSSEQNPLCFAICPSLPSGAT